MVVPAAAPQVHGFGAGSGNGTLQTYMPNYSVNNPSTGVQQAVGAAGRNNGLMNQGSQGFVDSIGQSLVQSMVGGGADGGGNGGGDSSASNSNSVLDVGSSVLSAVFGGSNSSGD